MSPRRLPGPWLLFWLGASVFAGEAPREWPAEPFRPITAERIAGLKGDVRPAWEDYWRASTARSALRPAVEVPERSPDRPLDRAPQGASYSVGLRLEASYTWYANEPARRIADHVVSWQTATGGWTKDGDYTRAPLPEDRRRDVWSGGTFDNDATVSELRFLAKVISHDDATPAARRDPWVRSFLRGLDYVLAAQYPNGGFPQIYPLVGGYHDSITYNDDGFAGLLRLLRDIGARDPVYDFVPPEISARAAAAYERGIGCILATQLRDAAGIPGVWCQQYDALTLEPCFARNFEPAAECSRESAGLVKLLLQVPDPSPAVVAAVDGAMRWFEARVIRDRYWNRNAPAGTDLEVRPGAPDLWARFYEFGTGRPIFGDRDRRIYYSVAEVSFERRKGYSWYCPEPAELRPLYYYWSHHIVREPRG